MRREYKELTTLTKSGIVNYDTTTKEMTVSNNKYEDIADAANISLDFSTGLNKRIITADTSISITFTGIPDGGEASIFVGSQSASPFTVIMIKNLMSVDMIGFVAPTETHYQFGISSGEAFYVKIINIAGTFVYMPYRVAYGDIIY